MATVDVGFASFEAKWLQAEPEQATVALFLAPGLRTRAAAVGCLIHELGATAFGDADVQVAAAKLHWWAQELAAGIDGKARHPVSVVLFADGRLRGLPRSTWQRLIEGALAQLDAPAARDITAWRETVLPFFDAAATVDLFASGDADPRRNAQLWAAAHLLRSVAHPAGPRGVPLDLLARHGIARSGIAEAAPAARNALVRDLLREIEPLIEQGLAGPGRVSLARLVRARLDCAGIRAVLAGGAAHDRLVRMPTRWRTALTTWRAARELARSDPAALGRASDG
jgi:hypothetical protein